MNSIQLFHEDGRPADVWYCEKCSRVGVTKAESDNCCRDWTCKQCGDVTRRYWTECDKCRRERQMAESIARLEKAEEISWDRQFMLFSEQLRNSRDGWYYTLDDVHDEIAERRSEDAEFEAPDFVFASIKRVKGLDLDRAIESMCEDTYEDAEVTDTEALKKLQDAVDEFNTKCAIVYFDPDYSRKVRV